ncbi:MAG: cupin domain-containing protein [Thermoleophilia bacterium]|nr:cupin domain-containing protein [Thermoleophilia bacterium]
MREYTVLRAGEAPDFTGDAPGAFLGYGRPLGAEQVAVNMRVLEPHTRHVAPGFDPAIGHSHSGVEEIYVVVAGEVRMKLGDEIETLGQYDAVLVPPETPRAVRNDSGEEARLLMVSVRMEDASSQTTWHDEFWP